ncbi:hypothetical protein C8A05DRAFT_20246 [Staphylotrichum tortipilum]|uniref:Cerato-platanin n=1 Tax=Staphylotrichum tortipilum TaxID=2831512 RepID=A0AAN6M9T8_9PEZI|nr:hypothetical protein C8A05DRAFT_20246 [Staphylotrichum longicolle]
MRAIFRFFLSALAAATARAASGTVWATPHESYSSSVGVLGCKVDTNRIAYWPASVDCDSICVSLSYEGRTVHLLRIDQSQGAHDVSYDAWNYLVTGYSATQHPTTGGAIAMEYADADASACADLIHTKDHKLPLSAANSMNYLASCLSRDTWVGKNHILYNILDPICSWGNDEVCNLDWPTANQAACPTALGTPSVLTTTPVYNIQYMTGNKVLASSNQVVANGGPALNLPLTLGQKSGGRSGRGGSMVAMMAMSLFTYRLMVWL